MGLLTTLLSLFAAAVLEAGGDAVIRGGLHSTAGRRLGLLAAGGLILFGYGCLVNAGRWDFGKLLGIYIVFFFVVAQAVGWLVFGQPPGRGIWVGGAFIVVGGAIVAVATR